MQKFFVAGMPRTGSTLLATTLDQNPKIKMHGELFHPVMTERAGPHALNVRGKPRFFDPDAEDAIAFLSKEVWSNRGLKKHAVGFKLFGDYVKAPTTDKLFLRILEAFPDVKLVTIWRENLLDCLISRQVARSSGKWMESSKSNQSETNVVMVEIAPAMAENFFQGYSNVKTFLGQISSEVPSFSVDYDELTNNFESVSANLFDFLGVSASAVNQAIKKQRTHTRKDYVVNWEELKNHFSETPYAQFFED